MDFDRKIDLIGVALVAFALVTFFAVTPSVSFGLLPQPTGGLTGRLDHVFAQLFGWGKIFVPFGVGAVGIWLMKESFEGRGIPIPIFKILGVTLLFTGALAWIHMIELFDNVQPSVEAFRPYSYALAVEQGRGGGWLGHEIYIFLLSQLLDFGTVSVLVAWMVMGAMLAFNLTVVQLVAYVTALFGFLHLRGGKERRAAQEIAKADNVPLQRGLDQQLPLQAAAGAAGAAAGAAAVVAADAPTRRRLLGRRKRAAEAEHVENATPARPALRRGTVLPPSVPEEQPEETPDAALAENASPARPTFSRRPGGDPSSKRAKRSGDALDAILDEDEDETPRAPVRPSGAERSTERPARFGTRPRLGMPNTIPEDGEAESSKLPVRSRLGLRRKHDETADAAPSAKTETSADAPRKGRKLPFGRPKRGKDAEEAPHVASTPEDKTSAEKSERRRLGLGLRKRQKDDQKDETTPASSEERTALGATAEAGEAEGTGEKAQGRRLGGFLKRRQASNDTESTQSVSSPEDDAKSERAPAFVAASAGTRPPADEMSAEDKSAGKRSSPFGRSPLRRPFGKTESEESSETPEDETAVATPEQSEARAPARPSPLAQKDERAPRVPRSSARTVEEADEEDEIGVADKATAPSADDATIGNSAQPQRSRLGTPRAAVLGAASGANLAAARSEENTSDADDAAENEEPRVPLRPLRPSTAPRAARGAAPDANEKTADAPQRPATPARPARRPSVVRPRPTDSADKPAAKPEAPAHTIGADVIRRRSSSSAPSEKPSMPAAARAEEKTATPAQEATRSAADAPTLPLEKPEAAPAPRTPKQPAKPPASKAEQPKRKPQSADKPADAPARSDVPIRRRSAEGRGVSAIAASVPAKSRKPARPKPETPSAKDARPSARSAPPDWEVPNFETLLRKGDEQRINDEVLLEKARVIEDTLASFGAPGKVVEVNPGPVITQFGVEPDYVIGRGGKKTRVKVSAIARLDADLALALAARSIRIEAPVPGKGFVGIEVPNDQVSLVGLYDIMEAPEFSRLDSKLRLALGLSVDGTPVAADLTAMPHLLIAGTTGSGKSVCVNAIISCLLLQNSPEDLQFIMVDPKRVELTGYNGIPHLVAPVVVELERIVGVLQWIQREMEERYRKFAAIAARNILDYNRKVGESGDKLPYYVVVVDELADLMMLAPDETERLLARLAQMARATGIHLIISTQRPSVDIITGLIKANFPARIAFAVVSSVDSRVILDQPGAEKLLGRGDMLFQSPDAAAPLRMQGVFVSDDEIMAITRYWKEQMLKRADATGKRETLASPRGSLEFDQMRSGSARSLHTPSGPAKQSPLWEEQGANSSNGSEDALYEEAVELVQRLNKASISLLQRRLRIGYTRAARLIDMMEAEGIVGAAESGSKPREVLKRRVESGDD